MHVLQTPVRFAPDIGGVESYVQDVSSALVERGHEVTVVCANTRGYERVERIDGITVRRLSSPFSIANTNVTPALPVALGRLAREVDVIHTHLPTPWCADISAVVGALTGTPTVLTYHNDIVGDGLASYVAEAYNATALRATLSLVDHVLVTREAYLDESDHLSAAREVDVVRNGVDTSQFAPVEVDAGERKRLGFATDRPNVFFLSVLDAYHEYKGLDVLLAAVERLTESGTPPHLLVGGDGPLRKRYERQVRERGLDEHVTFAGRIPDADLGPTYSAADAFVLPSTSTDQEGFGLVALEALACGTPVVTTDIVGVAEAIERERAGIVVEKADSTALADGISTLLADAPADQGHRGRRLCEREYSWAESVDQLVELYREVGADR